MPSASTLFIGIFAGAVGVSYFIYGKRMERIAFLVAGVGLCIYPYMVDGILLQIVIGLGLVALPIYFSDR